MLPLNTSFCNWMAVALVSLPTLPSTPRLQHRNAINQLLHEKTIFAAHGTSHRSVHNRDILIVDAEATDTGVLPLALRFLQVSPWAKQTRSLFFIVCAELYHVASRCNMSHPAVQVHARSSVAPGPRRTLPASQSGNPDMVVPLATTAFSD
jgi:hypothetical protein